MYFKIEIEPLNVILQAEAGKNLMEVLQDGGVYIEAECGGQGTCETCVAAIIDGGCKVNGKVVDEGVIKTCQAEICADLKIRITDLQSQISGKDYSTEIGQTALNISYELSPLSSSDTLNIVKNGFNYGIACDVGTTSIAMHLVNLPSGKIIDTVSDYNGQIRYGADVISRIIYSGKLGKLQELQNAVLKTINSLIERLKVKHHLHSWNIVSGVFSGNTTMAHMFLGIDPQNIRISPYEPPMKFFPLKTAAEVGIHIEPQAPVYISPCVGSYVGGDITAGVSVVKLMEKEGGNCLLIDVGTNGELVLIGEGWMIGCACSAGPAFEGAGISCGMRAAEGSIESITLNADNGNVDFSVMGEGKPKGICGSGLIELTAELFLKGIIGRDGKFTESVFSPRIIGGRNKKLILYSGNNNEISISEQDIDNIIRAKGAIFSATLLLLRMLDLNIEQIGRFYIAGGFGRNLNIEAAISIGMFPDIDRNRYKYIGNSSLHGTYLALLYKEHRDFIDNIAKSMTYIDLSSEPKYMDEYIAALFLPHTDERLFPNVKNSPRRNENIKNIK